MPSPRRAFTLIELLVVIAIIAILVGLLLLGVLTAAAINLAMPQVGLLRRATATGTSAAAAILGCWAFEGNSHLLGPLAIALASVLVPCLLLGTQRGHSLDETE